MTGYNESTNYKDRQHERNLIEAKSMAVESRDWSPRVSRSEFTSQRSSSAIEIKIAETKRNVPLFEHNYSNALLYQDGFKQLKLPSLTQPRIQPQADLKPLQARSHSSMEYS